MKIKEIAELVDGEIVGAPCDESYEVEKAFSSDLMSDVLRFSMDETVLITGLCNITIIKSKYSIFKLSGILYNAGIKPLY